MTDELAVWLHGVRVAVVRRDRGRLRMTYTRDALDQYQLGTPLLSLSLPLTGESYPQGVVRAFLDGLLPEGEPRRIIAREFGIRENDTFALRLAPLYDLMSTLVYGDDRLAMYIDGVRRIDHVTGDRIVNEAASWGLLRRRASEIVADVVARTPAAVAAARDETYGLQPEIPDLVQHQVARLTGSA